MLLSEYKDSNLQAHTSDKPITWLIGHQKILVDNKFEMAIVWEITEQYAVAKWNLIKSTLQVKFLVFFFFKQGSFKKTYPNTTASWIF